MAATTTTLAVASIAASVVGAGMSAYGQMQAGKAAQAQANYQAGVMRNNAILAQRAADDARLRGEAAAKQHADSVKQLKGRQIAVLAANGQVVNQDSALDLTDDTVSRGKYEELLVRSNAEREALGYEAQGGNFQADANLATMRGNAASSAASFGVMSSLIGGAGSVAEKWYGFNKEKVPGF